MHVIFRFYWDEKKIVQISSDLKKIAKNNSHLEMLITWNNKVRF